MANPQAGLAIRVLGPLEVTVDGAPLVVDTRKALAILALLAAEERAFARDELGALLWPESDDESARGALRRTLSVLRTALGGRWLAVDRSSVGLPDAASWIDLRAVEAAATSRDASTLAAGAALARGPFLAGFSLRDSVEFDEWRATRASAVERTVATLLDRLADTLEAAGDHDGAAAAAGRRLELDPLDEAAHRRLMTLLARGGDRAGAVRQYRTCVAALDRELGVAPLAETTALYEAIRDGRLAAAATREPPPARRPGGPAGEAPGPGIAFRLPMVGRDPDLAAAHAVVALAAGSRVLGVTGEAGIGKTRLVEELAGELAAGGATVLIARGFASEAGIPYGTIVGLLRAGLTLPDAAERVSLLSTQTRSELSRLVDLPAGPSSGRRDSPEDRADPAGRSRLLGAVAEALTAFAGPPGPGLIVAEDLQWIDGASREALGWLARRLASPGPALVLTWRPEDLDEHALAFVRSLESIPLRELALARLAEADVERLVRAAADAGITVPSAAGLTEASEGLPLFIAEAILGGAGGASGGDSESEAPGRGVRALLRERLSVVGETAGQVLGAAAVLGRSFDLGSVRAVSGRSEEETVDALEELVRRGLVREVAAGRGAPGWDFAHARLREAAYEATSLARRGILHRRAADLLRADPGTRGDPARLAQLAGHELAAGRGTEAALAFAEAGLGARALYANREAEAHLAAAIALGHPEAPRLQVALGEVRTALGDYRGAIAALDAAAAALPDTELPGIELRLGRAQFRRGDLGSAANHLDTALDALASAPRSGTELARALVERAAVAERMGEVAEATATAGRALVAAGDGDPWAAAAAHRVLGLCARDRGDMDAARRELERSLALAADDPDAGSAVAARNALALVLAAAGDGDAATAQLESALAVARRTGERHLEAAIENNLADVLHARGKGDAAMVHLKRAVVIFADLGGQAGQLEPEVWKLVAW